MGGEAMISKGRITGRQRHGAVLLLAVFLLGALGSPASTVGHTSNAQSGYHYAGAQTTARYDGAYASIEATDPKARAGTTDFNANRIMGKSSSGIEWIEVGWAETGWALVGGVPEQYVYVYDSPSASWHFYNALAGGHIDVRIINNGTCGTVNTLYTAQLFDHGSGAWSTLRSACLSIDRLYLEEYTEVSMDTTQTFAHMEIDQANNDLGWFETQRKFADGSWRLWSATNTAAGDSNPTQYCTSWITANSEFDTHKGGTC